MKESEQSGGRTLLWSVIMSAPGPLVVGLGLLMGKSNTQLADFVRRSAELMAIIVSFVVYRLTAKEIFPKEKKKSLEKNTRRFVGAAMCIGGIMMLLLAILSHNEEQGNVIPGLCIALLGVVANTIFWVKYSRLGKTSGNGILLAQSRLYGAKSLVDGCVTVALCSVMLLPGSLVSYYLDKIGSAVVAIYLVFTGIRTIFEKKEYNQNGK